MLRRLAIGLLVGVVATSCTAPDESQAVLTREESSLQAPEITPTGRAALAATHGEPHILWFWGAH